MAGFGSWGGGSTSWGQGGFGKAPAPAKLPAPVYPKFGGKGGAAGPGQPGSVTWGYALTPGGGRAPATSGQIGAQLSGQPPPPFSATATPAPAAPASPVSAPAPAPTPSPSPLDSTYYANVNANQFKTNNSINALNQTSGFDSTALQSALAQLAYQQPRQQLQLEDRANQAGNLYSTAYGQKLGDLNYSFAGRQGGLVDSNAQKQSAIASQIAALTGGNQAFDVQQYLDAVNRSSAAAAKNPLLGQNVPAAKAPATVLGRPPAKPLAPKPSAKGKAKPGTLANPPSNNRAHVGGSSGFSTSRVGFGGGSGY